MPSRHIDVGVSSELGSAMISASNVPLLGNWITLIAIGVFAITGVLAGLRKGADIFSTIRDMILNIPVFWVNDLSYIWVAVGAAFLAFFVYRVISRAYRLLLYLDAIGVALFTIQSIDKVLGLGHPPAIAIIMGIITGIGGGLVRDVLTDRPNLLMTKDLYATPILVGSILYLALLIFAPSFSFSWLAAMIVIFGFRAAAIHWDLSMPGWLTAKSEV
jgi:uncharacterized membrane protein YeiH